MVHVEAIEKDDLSVQGYLAHEKQRPPSPLQKDYSKGPVAVLGGGGVLMSEVPLYSEGWWVQGCVDLQPSAL